LGGLCYDVLQKGFQLFCDGEKKLKIEMLILYPN